MDFWLAGLETPGCKQFLWRVLVSCWQHECHLILGYLCVIPPGKSLSLLVSLFLLSSLPCLPHFLFTSLNLFCPHSQMMTLLHISLREWKKLRECIHSLSLWINSWHRFLSFFSCWSSHYAYVTPFAIIPQFYHFLSFLFLCVLSLEVSINVFKVICLALTVSIPVRW